MRPDLYGLRIAPSIPKEWELFEIDKDFRGCHLHITVKIRDMPRAAAKTFREWTGDER